MDYTALRARALRNVRSNWVLSIGAAAIMVLLAGIGTSFLPDIQLSWTKEIAHHFDWIDELKFTVSTSPTSTVTVGPISLLALAQLIIGGVLELGYSGFLLKQHDGKPCEFNDLFSRFDRFGNGFAQRFLRNLYVMLWSLLLVIPGIVASYSYAMTPYIMAENPELSANEAIARSKQMMDGHKGELFTLDLTFIGWHLLAALTLNIGYLWLNPYKNAAYAAFYRQLVQAHPYL